MTCFVRTATRVAFLLVSLPTLAGVACSSGSGGEPTTGNPGGGASDGGCVDVDLTSSDLSCTQDSDCSPVSTSFCPGYVPTIGSKLGTLCPNAAANATGVAKVATAMAAVPHGGDAGNDFCDAAAGTPRCLQSQCVYCAPGDKTCGAASSSSTTGP